MIWHQSKAKPGAYAEVYRRKEHYAQITLIRLDKDEPKPWVASVFMPKLRKVVRPKAVSFATREETEAWITDILATTFATFGTEIKLDVVYA